MELPLKDLEKEYAIPNVWKDSIFDVIVQLTKDNFELRNTPDNIYLQSIDLAKLNRENVLEYGCSLMPLIEEC